MIGFLCCAIALIYPVLAQKWNEQRDRELISEYDRTVVQNKDAYADELKKAQEYNEHRLSAGRNIVTDALYDPDPEYESMLDVSANGMMGWVEIPSIDVEESIYHYTTDTVLGMGVGHIHGSSLPVGGDSTHTVITGHRGLPNQRIFTDLDRVRAGDRFYLHVLGHTLAYEVCDIRTVLPTDVGSLMIEDGKDLATLVTCTPYGVNTHRLLVTGKRVPYEEESPDGIHAEKYTKVIDYSVYVLGGFILFFIIMTVIFVIAKHRKEKAQ